MRLLFYTATAFFVVLAGVFGFYAMNGPEHPSGAKVVLSIDSRGAPGAATEAVDPIDRDLYAEAAARLQGIEAGKPGSEEVIAPEAAEPEAAEPEAAQQDAGPNERVNATAFGGAQGASESDAQSETDEIPNPPPGTSLAGLDNERPLFKNIGQDEQAAGDSANVTSTAAEERLPGTQIAAGTDPASNARPAQATQESRQPAGLLPRDEAAADSAAAAQNGEKPALDAILAALNEREGQVDAAASAPAGPPPPVPLRRSTATAAVSGWGNTKITKSDSAAIKPVRIAILLRGLGRDDRNSSDAVTKLPPAVSLAFMPFAGAAQQWARKATEQGHEVIVQLPLEPTDYPVNNPGPETLLASSSADQNTSRLGSILARFEGYSGVTNFLGGRMLQSKEALRPILEDIKSRGLIYIGEGNSNNHAVVRGLAGEIGLRYGGANVMIDAQPSPAAIQAALERLVAIARKQGSAIGLGYGSRATIEQIQAWAQTLPASGVTLVPVGTLAQTPGAS